MLRYIVVGAKFFALTATVSKETDVKKKAGYLITVVLAVLVLGSCTSISKITEFRRENPEMETHKSDFQKIINPYTLESLLLPVLQMSNFMMSMDYFSQFLDYNDYIFPDYLFTLLAMETDTYNPGEGTVLLGDSGSGLPVFKFEKAFLAKTDDDDTWWRYLMLNGENDLSIEVLVNSFGVPAKIRFENSESGQKFEIVPDLAIDFERAITEVPPDQLSASIAEKINRSISESFSMRFVNPVIVGEELVKTKAGEFMAVLIRDFETESNTANYWLSPDVPGGIVRVSVTDSTGEESHITELIKISKHTEAYFSGEDIIPYSSYGSFDEDVISAEPGSSEGSVDSPVSVYPYEEHYGSVGDEGISYYKYTNTKRADLFIEVYGFEGSAELIYFGNDSTFENWTTSSEGSSLNIEDYMVLPGETVYFSVNDIIDEYSIGEYYTIFINQNPILDPIGIMMKGDIYDNAEELESGKSYSLIAGSEGLDYYKTTVKKGSTLVIEILNEPDFGNLLWFDTGNGSYSGMYSDWGSDNSKTIKVEGLEPGTVCYYYFSSDTDLLDPLQKLVLQITELP